MVQKTVKWHFECVEDRWLKHYRVHSMPVPIAMDKEQMQTLGSLVSQRTASVVTCKTLSLEHISPIREMNNNY